MTGELVAGALWTGLAASVLLTVRALIARSWPLMWAAAVLSLLVGLATGFGIGPLVFLVTGLQLAGATSLRWSVGWPGWTGLLALAGVLWTLLVLAPLLAGGAPPWLAPLPVVLSAALGLLLRPRAASSRPRATPTAR